MLFDEACSQPRAVLSAQADGNNRSLRTSRHVLAGPRSGLVRDEHQHCPGRHYSARVAT